MSADNILSIICDPQCDLLDMPAVKQLERDPKYEPVYRLLEIFLTGRLADYLEFQAADAATLENYGMFIIFGVVVIKLPAGICMFIDTFACMQDLYMRIVLLRCG